eukprot:1177417-Prorocentrum_lima.AAC.1
METWAKKLSAIGSVLLFELLGIVERAKRKEKAQICRVRAVLIPEQMVLDAQMPLTLNKNKSI